MPNQAFQNSLRSKFSASLHSKDRDKFIASLREGGTVEDKSYWEETASNIIPSGKKLLKETADMIMNPIDTAKSLYQLGSGVVQLAIPGEQGNEGIARAAGQYFADRYGSLEKAKESFKNDPIGVATEALGVVAGGTGLGKLAVKGAGKAKRAIDREIELNAIKDSLKHGDNRGNILTDSARLDIASFNPKTSHFWRNPNKPVDEFLEGIPLSLSTDTKYAKSYAYSKGFLYEIDVPKPILRKLFDYKNPDHIKKFKKQFLKDIKDPNNPVSEKYIWAQRDSSRFVEKDPNVMYDIKRTAKDNENIADDLVEILKNSNENYLVMENPFVTHTLKKLKYKGTWQTEVRDLADTGTSKFTTYRQIQLFNGKDANIKKVYNINSNEMTPRLYKGGIPTAATGSIGLEEIKVTHTDGGGGRDFSGFRGSGKEYAMNYEPSRGGVEQGGTGSAEKQTEELLKEETPEVEEIVVTGSYDNTLDRINKLTTWYSEIGNSTNVNREQLAKAITDASEKNNVNADFLTTILAIETDLKEGKTSSTGAEGLSQIDPNMLKDINRIYKMNLKMEDLQDMNVAVDAQAKAINIVRMYARHYGHDHNNNEVIGQIYNIGIGDYNNGVRNPRYFGDRGKERADIMGVDIFSMPMTNDVPKLQEGGTPWGGATGTIYKEPSGPKPLQQQMINAFSEGGTLQNTELEETVVTGQRGKADYPGALNNPSSILNPNYQTWQNFQNIPTPMKDFARKPPEGFSEEAGTKTVVRGIDKSNELRNTSYDLRLDLAQRYNDDRFLDRTLVSSDEIIKLHKDFLAIAALQEGALPDLAKDLKTKQQLEDDTTLDYDEFKEYELAEAKYGNEFEETMKEVEDNKFEKKPAGIILKKIKEILNTDTDQISDKTIDKYNSFMTLLKTDYPELYEDETIVLYGPRTKRNLPYTKDDIPTTIYPTYEPPYNYGANLEKIDDFNKLPKGMTSLKNLDSEFKTKISMIKEVPNLIYELNNGLDSVIENNLINITT